MITRMYLHKHGSEQQSSKSVFQFSCRFEPLFEIRSFPDETEERFLQNLKLKRDCYKQQNYSMGIFIKEN